MTPPYKRYASLRERWDVFLSMGKKNFCTVVFFLFLLQGIVWLPSCGGIELTSVNESILVELDGSASSDPDGDRLEYYWKQIEGPPVTLSSPHVAKPYFRTSIPGTYRFELVVSDGKVQSKPVTVEVVVERPNTPPEAILDAEVHADLGECVVLDGGRSRDPDGDALLYEWRQVSGPPLSLSPLSLRRPKISFTPPQGGIYEFELTVDDGKARSSAPCRLIVHQENAIPVARAPTSVRIRLEPRSPSSLPVSNLTRPVAIAQGKTFVAPAEPILLDGSQSLSPRGLALRYYWKQLEGPRILSFEEVREGVLRTVPPAPGEYVFQLVVSDGKEESTPSLLRIQVGDRNDPPIAVAEAPSTGITGEWIRLDGSKSFDREGASLTYSWRQIEGPPVQKYHLDEGGSVAPLFLPSQEGRYVFSLTVSDGMLTSDPARVAIDIRRGNGVPTVRASREMVATIGESVLLQSVGDDPDGDSLQYCWRQIKGPTLLQGEVWQQSIELTPSVEGDYLFQVIATDGISKSRPAETSLRVRRDRMTMHPSQTFPTPPKTDVLLPPSPEESRNKKDRRPWPLHLFFR